MFEGGSVIRKNGKAYTTMVEPEKELEGVPAKDLRSIAISVLSSSPFENGRADDLNPIQEEMRRQAVLLYQQKGLSRAKRPSPIGRGLARAMRTT
jgi:hypothetical protein